MPSKMMKDPNAKKGKVGVNIQNRRKNLQASHIGSKHPMDYLSSFIPNKKSNWKIVNLSFDIFNKYFNMKFAYELFFNPNYMWIAACICLIVETFLNIVIIENVKYTEIDWVAYMQEVGGVVNGTWDYTQLKGDTGPLVYPAGFVYIFGILYFITDRGSNIYIAQYIFAGFYLLTLSLVFRLYCRSKKLPPYLLLFVCFFSYRIHSIYVLRLFNDPVAMLLLYASLNCFVSSKWSLGSVLFSFAVSVKMNILLFSPGLLLVYILCLGFWNTLKQLCICGILQVMLGFPFLLANPLGYIKGAFNLGRIFLFKWTVNWRFLPEDVFVNPKFHLLLLGVHLSLLVLFGVIFWKRYVPYFDWSLRMSNVPLASHLLMLPLFVSNFIGIACSRSLHYQFYIWYFHTIPYLLWSTSLSVPMRLTLMGVVELCWNTYPSTWWSSALLHACHVVSIVSIMVSRESKWPQPNTKNQKPKKIH